MGSGVCVGRRRVGWGVVVVLEMVGVILGVSLVATWKRVTGEPMPVVRSKARTDKMITPTR